MITKLRPLTIADWDAMPYRDGNRYEIIEGELFVSCSPGLTHDRVLTKLILLIGNFLEASPIGETAVNVGVILSNVSGVIPDLLVFLNEQRDTIITNDRLTGPPALVIEILSPGAANIRRDRVNKLQLYDKHGVSEYWIVDPEQRAVEVYRPQQVSLDHVGTFMDHDDITSPLFPDFRLRSLDIFML